MTFFASTVTPLYSKAWTPSSTATYAGTCIFLILLATSFRALFALRGIQERKQGLAELRRQAMLRGKTLKFVSYQLNTERRSAVHDVTAKNVI